ncbi:MAG: hypothetical protein KA054_01610 [Candidatus Moranbacteria bacterium]|nr:hypothetical protein [Candidatus Moranbacteria bacterium]
MFSRIPLFISFVFGVLVVVFLVLWDREIGVSSVSPETLMSRVALADDDEEEDEEDEEDDEDEEDEEDDEDEEDGDDEDDASDSRLASSKETVLTTYRLVEKTVTVLDEKFRTDTDGDLLVDGLDPHPTVPEKEYFTDDDEDAVPNALDAHPGEDDFFIFEDTDDQDGNGILDAFQILAN